jgi:hypothetical protein
MMIDAVHGTEMGESVARGTMRSSISQQVAAGIKGRYTGKPPQSSDARLADRCVLTVRKKMHPER